MFEKYTENARRTIFMARYWASNYGSPQIETRHLLLGLMQEDPRLFLGFLEGDLGRLAELRSAVQSGLPEPRRPMPPGGDLPLSATSRRVLSYGAEEAQQLTHIGTEHHLLGLLREDGLEVAALNQYGITLEGVRAAVGRPMPGPPPAPVDRETVREMLEKVPQERLQAAAQLLAALSARFFSVSGRSTEGPFRYVFGEQ